MTSWAAPLRVRMGGFIACPKMSPYDGQDDVYNDQEHAWSEVRGTGRDELREYRDKSRAHLRVEETGHSLHLPERCSSAP